MEVYKIVIYEVTFLFLFASIGFFFSNLSEGKEPWVPLISIFLLLAYFWVIPKFL